MTARFQLLCTAALLACAAGAAAATPTAEEVLDASGPAEWRTPDPDNLLVMELAGNRQVVIELAPRFAPEHVANLRTLVREHYFDATSVYRVQDNFVAQWGDPESDNPASARSMGSAAAALPPEYTVPIRKGSQFTVLPDGDLYAPVVGFVNGMAAARDPEAGTEWLVHCYGAVGVARDTDPTSGSANTLYVPIGQAPRRLDHQLAVVGRVLVGMQWLAALPRGPEPMGMYTDPAMQTRIVSVRLPSDLPADKRPHLEVLRSDSESFARLIEAKRNRKDAFYPEPVGTIGICDVPLPVREREPAVMPGQRAAD